MALALIFMLLLCCQSTSASSLSLNVTNGQHKSSREDYNSLSRNNDSNQQTIYENIEKRPNFHHSQSVVRRDYGKECHSAFHCSEPNTHCFLSRCDCVVGSIRNSKTKSCDSFSDYINNYGGYCLTEYDCQWTGMECLSSRCLCPSNSWKNSEEKSCDPNPTEPSDPFNVALLIIIVFTFTSVIIYSLIKRYCQSDSRPAGVPTHKPLSTFTGTNGVSTLKGTSSTVEVMTEVDDSPPNYSDVHRTAPQEREDEQHDKLPTYDEVAERHEWNSPPLTVIEAHSSEEARHSPLTSGTEDSHGR